MDNDNKEFIIIYLFVSHISSVKPQWFTKKEDAIFFGKHLYNLSDEQSIDDELDISEHKFYLKSSDICSWLNKLMH